MVIDALCERLGIGKTLRDICKANRLDMAHERALLAMTANRLCEPESKLGVWERWLSKVYMPSCDGLDLDQMYEAMDVLYYNATKGTSFAIIPRKPSARKSTEAWPLKYLRKSLPNIPIKKRPRNGRLSCWPQSVTSGIYR